MRARQPLRLPMGLFDFWRLGDCFARHGVARRTSQNCIVVRPLFVAIGEHFEPWRELTAASQILNQRLSISMKSRWSLGLGSMLALYAHSSACRRYSRASSVN